MSKRSLASLIFILSLIALFPMASVPATAAGDQKVTAPMSEDEYPIITRNTINSYDGFDYELWSQRSSDAVKMVLTGGGTFRCDWDAENVLFRTGKKLGSTKTFKDYGNITMEYEAEHNITRGDVSYLCMYGWTVDPLIEFYIIENHGNYKPPGGKGYQGSYELDGSTYKVYVDTRVQKPSIQGTKTFQQYFSVRTDKRTSGTISISDHFKEWENIGLDMGGKMYEVSLCVEGYMSSGNVNVSQYMLTMGDTVYGTPIETSSEQDESKEAIEASEVTEVSEVTEASEATEVSEVSATQAPVTQVPVTQAPITQASTSELPMKDDSSGIGTFEILIGVFTVLLAGCVIFLFVSKLKRKK